MLTLTPFARRWVCLAWCLTLSVFFSSSALAAPTNATAADVQYRRGSQAFAAKKFGEALTAFQASQELEPSPNTRFKIAQCYLLLNKTASAFVNFRRAASEAEGRLNATHEQRYDLTRKAAILEAAAIESQVPRLTLAVPSDVPEGFRVLLDATEIPRGAWGIAVETDPGTYTLFTQGPRVKPHKQTLTLKPGQQLRVDVPLQRVATGTLTLSYKTKPMGLAVYLDNQPLTLEQFEVPHYVDVGKHKVRASAPGYADFTWSRSLADGDSRTVEIDLSPATGTPKWVFFSIGAAALATAAVGIGFGVKAQSASNDELAKPIIERTDQARDAIRTDATASTIAFSIAGAFGVTATVLAFTTRWRNPKPTEAPRRAVWQAAPVLGPQQAGFLITRDLW